MGEEDSMRYLSLSFGELERGTLDRNEGIVRYMEIESDGFWRDVFPLYQLAPERIAPMGTSESNRRVIGDWVAEMRREFDSELLLNRH